ncbi:hypothetical protein LX16_5025 [Stackebrandtia albiflava]|uniref:Uncharacterized protein n=1 Tax=Stackebrandtia albiflava TaxID=406432 RepID=A0A562UPK1_9ACTN|nr:hypothetical protein [Stackebrandtia albiflava]TWJ07541.1 hypothetical protein LX16_5025 [Stackebrandtia albiflava]
MQQRDNTGSWRYADVPYADDAAMWIAGRLPDDWFIAPPEVSADRDELIVIGRLETPDYEPDATDADRAAAEESRISRFREATRDHRVRISQQIQHRYQRRASWGAACGDTRIVFTHQTVPVMSRLRQPERQVLDTLVDSGVARSRSDALSWCVRLVGEHADSWLAELRSAMEGVDELRRQGPNIT